MKNFLLIVFCSLWAFTAQAQSTSQIVVDWGESGNNQLFPPFEAVNVTAISAGYTHTAVVNNGILEIRGNQNGSATYSHLVNGSDIKELGTGIFYTAYLKNDGTVGVIDHRTDWNKGNDYIDDLVDASKQPSGVVSSMAVGDDFIVALLADGSLFAWGSDEFGQVSNVPAVPVGRTVSQVEAGASHALVLLDDGSVIGWGRDDHNQVSGASGYTGLEKITAGELFSLGLKDDGTLVGWGDNLEYGQLNFPTEATSTTDNIDIIDVVAGTHHAVALTSAEEIVVWGIQTFRQADLVDLLDGRAVKLISAGYGHTAVIADNLAPDGITSSPTSLEIDENNKVYGWGVSIGSLYASDRNTVDAHTFSMVSGGSNFGLGNYYSYSTGNGDGSNDVVWSRGNTNSYASIYALREFNYEQQNEYTISVVATDIGELSTDPISFTIKIIDVNEEPTDISLDGTRVDEGKPVGEKIGAFSTIDEDTQDSYRYDLVGGIGSQDNSYFSIVGDELRTNKVFSYNERSTYSIRVRSTDNINGDLKGDPFQIERTFIISINDVNNEPTDIQLSNNWIYSGVSVGSAVGFFTTQDPDLNDNGTHQYTLVSGSGSENNANFAISGNQLVTNAEASTGFYSIRVRSTDRDGAFIEEPFIVAVRQSNQAPTAITITNNRISEKATAGLVIGQLQTDDPDISDRHTYRLVSGSGSDDNSSFYIQNDLLYTNSSSYDYDTQNVYKIRVRSTDDGLPSALTVEQELEIHIIEPPANNPPTDITLSNNTVAENQALGTTVGTLTAVDVDVDDFFVFTLVDGEADNGLFSIVSDRLVTNTVFDFETEQTYTVKLQVRDQGLATLDEPKTFTITITDENDAPTDIVLDNFEIEEDMPVGTTVGNLLATDEDATDNHTFVLVDVSGSDFASFEIDGNTLKSKEVFDYEVKASYAVWVKVADKDGEVFEKPMIITVTNGNEPPTNIFMDKQSIMEGLPVATLVGSFHSEDTDVGDSHTYQLIEGGTYADNALFQINDKGQLLSNVEFAFIDAETRTIKVQTMDAEGETFSKEFVIDILKGRVNNAPTDILADGLNVNEDASLGTLIASFTAVDIDLQDVSVEESHTFELVDGEEDNASFVLEGTQLRANAAYDFEAKETHTILVRVQDVAGATYDKKLTVNVLDVNEAPTDIQLSANTVVKSQEMADNVPVGYLSAEDPDLGDSHTYRLVSDFGNNDLFALEGAKLVTNSSFKYSLGDDVESLTVKVKATDSKSPSLSFEKEFTVNVIRGPKLYPSSFTIRDEDADLTVGTIDVQDGTEPFVFSIISGNQQDAFAIDNEGNITVANTEGVGDYTSYSLIVKVRDVNNLEATNTALITVLPAYRPPVVGDETFEIPEYVDTGFRVGEVEATTETNTALTYEFSAGNEDGIFLVNRTSGVITVNKDDALEPSVKSTYTLTVLVRDGVGLSAQATIIINIEDVKPTLNAPYNFTVQEHRTTGFEVGTVVATSPIEATFNTYEIISGNDSDMFEIHDSGVVTVKAESLITADESYTLTVKVTDEHGLTAEGSVVITVEDVDPSLADANFTVSEHQKMGYTIGTLTATSPVDASFSTYEILSGNDANFFDVNNTGAITVKAASLITADESYTLTVKVTDEHGLTAEGSVVITVEDADPSLADANFNVDEYREVGYTVGTLTATSPIEGTTFESFEILSGNDNNAFQINNQGEITLASSLDPSVKSSYQLVVKVVDEYGLTAEATVTIVVNDLNPTLQNASFTVNEYDENGSVVGSLSGISEAGLTLTYSIVSGNKDNAFAVDASTGEITIANRDTFDPSQYPIYTITVKVEDATGSVEANLSITVLNENLAPESLSLEYAEEFVDGIKELVRISSVLGYFSTVDPDIEDTHRYELVAGSGSDDNSLFEIRNGDELIVNGELKASNKTTYSIRVRVTDSGNPSLSFEKVFLIQIEPLDMPTITINAFTPNGDGTNDTWDLSELDEFPNVSVQVFSPSGQQVFNSPDNAQRWDGKSNGNALPVGSYYYIIKLEDFDHTITGTVTILR